MKNEAEFLSKVFLGIGVSAGVLIAYSKFLNSILHHEKPKIAKDPIWKYSEKPVVETTFPEEPMSETDRMESVQRLEVVTKIITGIKETYPDAKKLKLDIRFEYQESELDNEAELCPIVAIEIER